MSNKKTTYAEGGYPMEAEYDEAPVPTEYSHEHNKATPHPREKKHRERSILIDQLKEDWKWRRVSHLPERIIKFLRIDLDEYKDKDCYELPWYLWERIADVWNKPVKFTPSEIDLYVNNMPDEAFTYRAPIRAEYLPPADEMKGIVKEIYDICKKIRDRDSSFQNLNSEKERAEKYADEAERDFDKLTKYIALVEEKDAEKVIEYLSLMNHMYLRVYGDAMSYRKTDEYPSGLEDALKSMHYDVSLKVKLHRYQTKELLRKVEATRRHEIKDVLEYTGDVKFNKTKTKRK